MGIIHKVDSIRENREKPTIEQVATENAKINAQLTETQLALCDAYELADAQAAQVTDLQMALCEMFELLEGGNT